MTVEPIAIVGMAGRFPGADNLDQYWSNLVAGRDCLTELSDEELLRHYERPGRVARPEYVRKRPILADADAFDPDLFGMTPRETELRDPQYRVMLETVHGAFEHAGYDPARFPGDIGLFTATNVNRYRYDYIEHNPEIMEIVGYNAIDVTNNADYMSTFVSYKLGLRGMSMTVLTACSSSLVAVHLACAAIRAGDCEMAVAGGVNVEFPYHRGYLPLPGGMRSMDGVVRSFCAQATGTNFGDGVGAVLLKPLAAAERDNDTVYAVVVGSAVNNDGSRKVGYSAPSVRGQSDCIRRAMQVGGVDPAGISYIEAHGTGTRVGDPVELNGLLDAFRGAGRADLPAQFCAVGSVKSNIGHLGQAAGVAALIKTVLALNHRTLPPSINVTTPNPAFDWDSSPFYLNTERRDWDAAPGSPRQAGVSSFGIGGTNAHIILREAAPDRAPERAPDGHRPRREVLVWSAVNASAEQDLRGRLADHLDGLPADRFADTAYTLRVGRTPRSARAAVAAAGAADAARALRTGERVHVADEVTRRTVFAFPGQGSQYPGMFRDLYDDEPVFRSGCDTAFEVLRPLLDRDLRGRWLAGGDPEELADTAVTQPLLYVLEYTLAHCLVHWGVRPEALVGHSLGELVAGAVAGVFGFEDGLRAVAARALAIGRMPGGRMLAVTADRDTVDAALGAGICVAAVNGPNQVVLSGAEDDLRVMGEQLAARGITNRLLATSHAFHSPSLAPAVAEFESTLGALTLHAPEIPVISAATGATLSADDAQAPQFWARQIVQPVLFGAAVDTLLAGGPANVVEVGPGRALTTLMRGRSGDVRLLPTATSDGDSAVLSETLARLWVDGSPVNTWPGDDARGHRRVAAPGYPYQRRRFWIDPSVTPAPTTAAPTAAPTAPPTAAAAPAPAAPVATAAPAAPAGRWRSSTLEWVRWDAPVTGSVVAAAGRAVMLASADDDAARTAQRALQRAGYRTRLVFDTRRDTPAGRAGIDPTDPKAWLAELDAVAPAGAGPTLIVHAALLGSPSTVDLATVESQLTDGIDSLHGALKGGAVLQRQIRVPVRVLVLGGGIVDVTGGDPVNPVNAAVVGLVASAERETPAVGCQVIDLAARVSETVLADTVMRADRRLVAVRGRCRWLPRLVPAPADGTGPGLRESGTYLITGGLGGIGLVLARTLADTGLQPNLVLLGRSGPADRTDRDSVESELAAMRDAGATVEVAACDVADPVELGRVVDAAQARGGPVNGVIHAAGVPGGGLLERRATADLRAVLRPKVSGVLAIDETFAGRAPLDFLILCSSVAGTTGMYGSADYAAGNAFLDAYSGSRSVGRTRTVSVQWPGWNRVGMLARSPQGRALLGGAPAGPGRSHPARPGPPEPDVAVETVLAPGRDWQFDEHVFDGVPIVPGTGMLQLVVAGALAAGPQWPVDLRDVVFLTPLVGDGPRRIRVRVRALGSSHRIVLQSRPDTTDGPWTEHSTATRVRADARPGGPVDIDDLRARLPKAGAAAAADWIEFGPRWRSVRETWGDDTQRLARLTLPEPFVADLADHPVHPAIVDVAGGILHDRRPAGSHAPFLYRRVLVTGPVPADVYAHARFSADQRTSQRAVDFDILDAASGELRLHAEGYVLRAVENRGTGAAGAHRDGGATAVVTAAPPAAPADTARTPAPPAGDSVPAVPTLTPEEGAAIFLDLLHHGGPAVVLIEPNDPAAAPAPVPRRDDVPAVAVRTAPTPVPIAPVPAAPVPAVQAPAPAVTAPAARSGDRDVVAELRELWSSALGVADIDVDADFFDLGGNSLAAVQLTSRINERFDIDLGVGSLFDNSTVDSLAKEITALLNGSASADER